LVPVIAGDIRHRVPRPWRWPNILDLSPSLIVPGPGVVHAGQPEAITAEEDGDETVRRQRMADARSRTCVGDLQPLMPIPLPGVAWRWTDTNSPEKQHTPRTAASLALRRAAGPVSATLTQSEPSHSQVSGRATFAASPEIWPRLKRTTRLRPASHVMAGLCRAEGPVSASWTQSCPSQAQVSPK
jgi:hypothetical protein